MTINCYSILLLPIIIHRHSNLMIVMLWEEDGDDVVVDDGVGVTVDEDNSNEDNI